MRNLVMLASSQERKTKQNRFIKKAVVCEMMEMHNLFYLYGLLPLSANFF